MAICIDPQIPVNPMIDGVDTVLYERPFVSITEIKNWEFNNPAISRLKTYKIGYRVGFETKVDIVSEIKKLQNEVSSLPKIQWTAFKYGLLNGRTAQNLLKRPADLG